MMHPLNSMQEGTEYDGTEREGKDIVGSSMAGSSTKSSPSLALSVSPMNGRRLGAGGSFFAALAVVVMVLFRFFLGRGLSSSPLSRREKRMRTLNAGT